MRDLEKQLKALANRRRLAILTFLKNKHDMPVGDIAEEIELSFKSTSRHLAVLRSADIIEREQHNTTALYRIAKTLPPAVRHIMSLL